MKRLSSAFTSFVSAAALTMALSTGAVAEQPKEPALLVIGASYSNGNLPLNDNLDGVLGGINVGLGSYLDLGQALIKDSRLPGYVINEAVAGASTVAHDTCTFTECLPAHWISYDQQLDRALRRVAVPGLSGVYNAKYVVITVSNDCLHANTHSVPQSQTSPCTVADMNAYIDRMIALGQRVLDEGLTPIFDGYPKAANLDLAIPTPNFYWFIDDANFDLMGDMFYSRMTTELPDAVVLNIWEEFAHNGDGIHPDEKTSRKAAAKIAQYIIDNQ